MKRALWTLLLCSVLSCNGEETDPPAQLYRTEAVAPSLDEASVAQLDHLGPSLVDAGVNFGVYSANAERVELLLFDDPEASIPTQQFEMSRIGDVWNLYVEGVGLGQHYGFVAWGPNWPYDEAFFPGSQVGFIKDVDSDGNRFNPNKLLTDPYSLALHRDHDWMKGSLGTGESRRDESTWGASAKSIVIDPSYTWSENETEWREKRANDTLEGHGWNELVVYEVHPKGFTQNGLPEVTYPGTYRGIGEMAPYLADLGINAVELLPIHEKPLDGGYWGYNNVHFFAPEVSYSHAFRDQQRPDLVIQEFKGMVDALHQHGIEVWIDVVYNHTGEGGLWREKLFYNDFTPDLEATTQAVNLDSVEVAGLYNMRGLDNASYYALNEDGLTYWNNTGVGNATRPNHTPMRRLMMDSLHFMVEELHVDGFRFDLAGILGEQDQNYNYWYEDPTESALGVIANDLVLQQNNVRIIAEPWTAGGYYNPLLGAYPAAVNREGHGWGEWNGHFRDIVRSLINEDGFAMNRKEGVLDFGGALTGSYDMYAYNGRQPWHSVNFVTVHDGFTMYDLFSFNEKQNGCTVLNPVCCDDPFSTWCDTNSGEEHNRSRDWGIGNEATKRKMMRNAFTLMFVAHGTPLLLGGDEWMRTQYGNNNAYSTQADNEYNWFRWGEWRAYDDRLRMHDFTRRLIQFRHDHTYALSPETWGGGMPYAWKNADNGEPPDWSSKHMMMHYYSDETHDEAELLILINLESRDISFRLPEGRSWGRVLDTQAWFDTGDIEGEAGWFAENPTADRAISANITTDSPEPISDARYGVPPHSIVILKELSGE